MRLEEVSFKKLGFEENEGTRAVAGGNTGVEEGHCRVGEPGEHLQEDRKVLSQKEREKMQKREWMEGSQRAEVLGSTQDVEDSAL